MVMQSRRNPDILWPHVVEEQLPTQRSEAMRQYFMEQELTSDKDGLQQSSEPRDGTERTRHSSPRVRKLGRAASLTK